MHQASWRAMSIPERSIWRCSACSSISPRHSPNINYGNKHQLDSSNDSFDDDTAHKRICASNNLPLMQSDRSDHVSVQLASISEQLKMLAPLAALPNQIQQLQVNVDSLTKAVSDMQSVNQQTSENLAKAVDRIEFLEQENRTLNYNLESMYAEMQENLQYQRRNNLLISGIPCSNDREDEQVTKEHVQKLLTHLDIKFESWDIVATHRLPKRKSKEGRPNPGPPMIIVKFHNRAIKKAAIMTSITKKPTANLFGGSSSTRIYLNDHLTRENERLLGTAHYRLCNAPPAASKYFSVKFRDNRIIAKKTADSRPIPIRNYSDLEQLAVPIEQSNSSFSSAQAADPTRQANTYPS